jgi:hypothetical protein
METLRIKNGANRNGTICLARPQIQKLHSFLYNKPQENAKLSVNLAEYEAQC